MRYYVIVYSIAHNYHSIYHSLGLEKLKDSSSAAVICDVTVSSDVMILVECTRSIMKDRNCRLWAVVNNAGIAYSGEDSMNAAYDCMDR